MSGSLTTKTTLDRETMASYDVTVRATDGGTSTGLSVDRTFTIDVSDINDVAPVFTAGPYSNTVLETDAAGTNVVAIAATDGDATSTLTYDFEVGDTSLFQFGASGLELKAVVDLDSPANNVDYHALRIIVKDGGSPELTGTTFVYVTISAVNEHTPAFAAGFPSTVSVSIPANTTTLEQRCV